ncbi:MAG: HD-GYP domain-containing protein [Candidatus Methylomirabilales bacterium]
MTVQPVDTEQFLLSLNAAWKNLGLYSPAHPATTTALQRLQETLTKMLGGGERITLGILHDTLVVEGTPFTAKPDLAQKLVTRLQQAEIQGVSFLKGCTLEELRHFVEALARDIKGVEIEQDLKNQGSTHVVLVGVEEEQPEKARPEEVAPKQEEVVDLQQEEAMNLEEAGVIYSRALQTIRNVFQDVRLGKVPSLSEVQQAVEEIVGGILKGKHSLMALTMIKSYDEYLFNHSVNVGTLAMALGESLELDGATLRELGLGGLLHDLGKIRVPEEVTKKPGKLTEDEWVLMKGHPDEGVRLLKEMGVTSKIALHVVREHHVRQDRTGYPTLASDEQVHPYSMLITVADSYDALTTVRPYQKGFEPNEAITLMKTLSGSSFDPSVLERFIEMLGIYPPGTAVRLTTTEIAVVTRPRPEDIARPWVRIVLDPEGNLVDGPEVSLMEWDTKAEDFTRSIVVAVDPVVYGIDIAKVMQGKSLKPGG